jgi:GTP cyclohydrolase II
MHSLDTRNALEPTPRAAARATDALRRGWPVSLTADGAELTVLAIETADPVRLAAFDPDKRASLLLSAGRASTLDFAQHFAAHDPDEPVIISRSRGFGIPIATALADPRFDMAIKFMGTFDVVEHDASPIARVALRLAMLAGILPAFYVIYGGEADVSVSIADIEAHGDASRLVIAARARLPVAAVEDVEIVAFRTPEMPGEHIALVIGKPNGHPPLVRLHSECLTGDVLGSLKCDCGPQLHAAIESIAVNGWGILLYLRQEGRGTGLINKLRAYSLQDRGFDTVDANTRLGFAIDARDFKVATQMLRLLGEEQIRLLTNNPTKVATLRSTGINVVERVPHKLPSNPHNTGYLDTKRDRTGHAL